MPSNSGKSNLEKNNIQDDTIIENKQNNKPRSNKKAGDILVSSEENKTTFKKANAIKTTKEPSAAKPAKAVVHKADKGKTAVQKKVAPKGQMQGEDNKAVKRPVRRKKQKPSVLAPLWAVVMPPINAVGDFFYTIGFHAQSLTIRYWRVARNAGIVTANVLSVLFGGAGRRLRGFLHDIGTDLAAPFIRVRRNMRLRKRARKSENGQKGPRRSRDYGLLLKHVSKIVLPIAAAAVFFITVGAALSRNYALAVEVNGNLIGYVTDEKVIDDAGDLLRMKLSLAPDQSASDWQFTPVLHVATASQLSNKTQMADKILENSQNTIAKGTGLYVDGVLLAATTDGDELKTYLEEAKDKYADAERPDAEISFVRDVNVPDTQEVFLQESVKDFNQIEELLSQQVEPEVLHTVQEDETLNSIAAEYGITMDLLKSRNPVVAEKKDTFEPDVGTILLIRPAEYFLQVKLTYREYQDEELSYETETIENDTMVIGYKKTITTGETGLASVPYEYEYIDGELVSQVRVEDEKTVIKEPVAAVVEVGTKQPVMMAEGGGTAGSGQFIFPVPGSTYSTRGYTGTHYALDLNAVTGSPIYAADGGTVIFSGWRGLYGNCVEIDHGNGFKTLYAHNSALAVSPGQTVGQGQLIAYVGATGNASGPHCHFELKLDGQRIDPYNYVPWPYSVPWR